MYTLVSIPIALAVLFGGIFTVEREIVLSENGRVPCEKAWTDWSFVAIRQDGSRLAMIRPSERDVVTVNLINEMSIASSPPSETEMVSSYETTDKNDRPDMVGWIEVIANHGRRRNEVATPLAVSFSPSGVLIVSDMGNRRILCFDSNNLLLSSFLLTGLMSAPNEIRLLSNGRCLAAGLYLDTASVLNAGNYCTIYSETGEVLNSFAYTPQSALDKNLWTGVSVALDIADDGTIYAVFSTEPRIYVYSQEGELLSSFEWEPSWFIGPSPLAEPVFLFETPPLGFFQSWTRIIKLVYVKDVGLLIVAETNGLVEGCESRFVMDVITADGKVLHSAIATDNLPVGCDRDDNVYFLTLQGDRVLKTHLTQ